MKFGEQLKQQREKLGLSQNEVAERLSVTRQTISNWENSKSYPAINTLVKISDVYQISIDSLLKEDRHFQKLLSRKRAIRYFTVLALLICYGNSLLLLVMPNTAPSTNFWGRLAAWGLLFTTTGLDLGAWFFLLYLIGDDKLMRLSKRIVFPMLVGAVVIALILHYIMSASHTEDIVVKANPYVVISSLAVVMIAFLSYIIYAATSARRIEKFEKEVELSHQQAVEEGKIVELDPEKWEIKVVERSNDKSEG